MKTYQAGLLSILLSISGYSFAYHINDTEEVVLDKIAKTDCSISLNECRYYAAIEYIAFAKSCGVVYGKKRDFSDEKIEYFNNKVVGYIEDWKAIKEPNMHKDILSDDNKFRISFTKNIKDYLEKLSLADVDNECVRVSYIKTHVMPETASDLVQKTLNYKQWYNDMSEKRYQQLLNQNQ